MPDPFWDAEARLDAAHRSEAVYEWLLPLLAQQLNHLHRKQYSVGFWRIVIGPFLLWYTQTLYIRYIYVKTALKLYPGIKTYRVPGSSIPKNLLDFVNQALNSDAWNAQIFSQILEALNYPLEALPNAPQDSVRVKTVSRPLKQRFIKSVRRIFFSVANAVFPVAPIMMYQGYMPLSGRLKLALKSGFRILPMLPMNREHEITGEINESMREQLTSRILCQDLEEFESVVVKSLQHHMPIIFVEGFRAIDRVASQSLRYPVKRYPKFVLSDSGWYFNETFQVWAADCFEHGTRLIGVQHGGGYGDRIYSSSERHERKISETFVTWGWQEDLFTVPLPSLVLHHRMPKERNVKAQDMILWAATSWGRYHVGFEGGMITTQMISEYFAWQLRFAKALDDDKAKRVLLRLYHHDFGWGIRERWQETFPQIELESPTTHKNFSERLAECKLFVSDNINTTFLQALALNKPTLLFWNTDEWRQRPQSAAIYQTLSDVGIFHASPESAAAMLNRVYDQVDSWWNSSEVQKAKEGFLRNFGRTSPAYIDQWQDFLNEKLADA
jgi:putative transferase (TIGR04331 family)